MPTPGPGRSGQGGLPPLPDATRALPPDATRVLPAGEPAARQGAPSQPQRRRGLGIVVTLAVALLVLGAGIGVDRFTAGLAAQRVAQEVTAQAGGQDVAVTIHGFPFLTQAATRRFDHVDLTAASLSFQGLEIRDITASATGVDVRTETAERVEATGTIPTATVQSLVESAVSEAVGEGAADTLTVTLTDATVTASMDLLGLLSLGVDLEPSAQPRGIELAVQRVTLGGVAVELSELPFGIGDLLSDSLSNLSINLDGQLPEGLTLESIEVLDGAAQVHVTGTDVSLADIR